MNGKRKFTCKRCDKKTSDEWAQVVKHLPDGIDLLQENLDLCIKCFKKTIKEQKQTELVRELLEKGEISEEDLFKLQEDKQFRIQFFKKHAEAKSGELKKRNALIKEELLKNKVNK